MGAERAPRPLRGRLRIEPLAEGDLDRIHEASLRVLESAGLRISSRRILDALAESGAQVEAESQRVRFPSRMVEEAIARAPSRYALAARDPTWDVPIGAGEGYLSLDGCAAEIADLESGARRPPTTADLVAATRLADAVEEVAILWPCVAVTDVPPWAQAVRQTQVQLANSTKHLQAMSTFTARDARAVIEMARVVAGGSRPLRDRPIVSSFQCSISPLVYEGDAMEAALEFALAGVPCGFVAMALATATAPTTLAGHLVTVNAELLGGVAVLETLVPGAPTFIGPYQAFMDLGTGGIDLAWGPEEVLFKLAAAQLARRYALPMNILAFATGSKTQDWQAGAQHAISLMGVAAACEADLISATGTLYGSRVFALENVLLDAELFDLVRRLLDGWGTGEDDLALEVIEAVGPGGHFLGQAHTRTHMRELWMPRFFDRRPWEEWETAGRPGPRDAARDRVREILAEHEPDPLPEDAERELARIVESHEGETKGAAHGG